MGSNLDGTADTEDTVVGLLGRQTLDGLLDGLALLGDQVIEPIATGLVTVIEGRRSIGEFRSDRGRANATRAPMALVGGGNAFGIAHDTST